MVSLAAQVARAAPASRSRVRALGGSCSRVRAPQRARAGGGKGRGRVAAEEAVQHGALLERGAGRELCHGIGGRQGRLGLGLGLKIDPKLV